MSEDHYVAQTYLKFFSNQENKLIPYYKNKHVIIGKAKSTKSICKETNGDTSKYLEDPRFLDKYLPNFENNWKSNIQSLMNNTISSKIKYEISGYLAYLRSCTKTAKRLGIQKLTTLMKPISDEVLYENLPDDIDLKNKILKLLANDEIKIKIDSEYPHAININNLIHLIRTYFISDWMVVEINDNKYFVTSDNPLIVLENKNLTGPKNMFIPISPKYGIIINITYDKIYNKTENEKFDIKSISSGEMKKNGVEFFNEQIIKNAEDVVLHSAIDEHLEKLVKYFRRFKTIIKTDYLPAGNGDYIISREITSDSADPV